MRTARRRAVFACALTLAGSLALPMASARKSFAGAPRDGNRFVNASGPRPLPGFGEMFPFLMRKAWTSWAQRDGAALNDNLAGAARFVLLLAIATSAGVLLGGAAA